MSYGDSDYSDYDDFQPLEESDSDLEDSLTREESDGLTLRVSYNVYWIDPPHDPVADNENEEWCMATMVLCNHFGLFEPCLQRMVCELILDMYDPLLDGPWFAIWDAAQDRRRLEDILSPPTPPTLLPHHADDDERYCTHALIRTDISACE